MALTELQEMGLVLAVVGCVYQVMGVLVCAPPLRRVYTSVRGELVPLLEELCIICLPQDTDQCKTYDSTLALPMSAQATRALTVLSLVLCLLGLILGVAGTKCTPCMGDGNQASTSQLVRLAGLLFLLAGLFYMAPITWTAYAIVRDFYDPSVATPLKREVDPLFLGWRACILLLVGGALLHIGSSPPVGRTVPLSGGTGKNNAKTVAAGDVKPQEKSFV